MTFVLSDELFDAQLIRTLAYASVGAADLGECLIAARQVSKTDPGLWHNAWRRAGLRAVVSAERSQQMGLRLDARLAWFRASNYLRTAGLFLMGTGDDRFNETAVAQTDAFRAGAELLEQPPELLRIPYEGTTLPGYFFRAGPGVRPTMILTGGYDGTAEELYFANGAAALEHGYHVVAFDGPGQGSVIVDQGLPFRPDWEAVITPVVNHVVSLPGVDPHALVLHGWSLGGYLAPRGATTEHRLAACVSDCGPYDVLDVALARIPAVLASRVPDGNNTAIKVLRRVMRQLAKTPSAGWALRRNLWVHGVDDPIELLDVLGDYTLKGREHLIRCPTFVCSTAGDDLSASAHQLADRMTCPVSYHQFCETEGVTGHCELGGRAIFHQRLFAWLDPIIRDARSGNETHLPRGEMS